MKKRKFLYFLTQRTVLIAFMVEVIFFLIYTIGNFNNFSDQTQFALLQTLIPITIFTFFFCVCSVVESFVFFIWKRDIHYLYFIPSAILIAVISGVFFFFSNAVRFFASF